MPVFYKLHENFKTLKLKNVSRIGSICSLEKIDLGGIEQWILIRGRNKSNPILLCLHGGPGTAQIAFAKRYQTELEKYFVVVNWDQRGSGKSYSEKIPKESMNINQLLSDTYDLIKALLTRFNSQKLYLLGHSWGSVLGLTTSKNHPELIHSYIGIGQIVDIYETGRILYEFNLNSARKSNNTTILKKIESLGFPPLNNCSSDIMNQIKWAERFGGVFGKPGLKNEIYRTVMLSKEYTLKEKFNYYKASSFCFSSLLTDLLKINMFHQIPEVEVPVFLCAGRSDYNTPFELAEQYYNMLKAPKKELIWFENSGHAPHFEEPDKFSSFMVNTVLA